MREPEGLETMLPSTSEGVVEAVEKKKRRLKKTIKKISTQNLHYFQSVKILKSYPGMIMLLSGYLIISIMQV